MKPEITLYLGTVEHLIATYDELAKKMKNNEAREYFIGKRTAYEDLLILFSEDKSISDMHSEAFTPSDEC